MNIYIEPAIEKILRKEPSMSGLINELLRKHYGYERHQDQSKVDTKIIKTKQDAIETVKNIFPKDVTPETITYKRTSNWGA